VRGANGVRWIGSGILIPEVDGFCDLCGLCGGIMWIIYMICFNNFNDY
jgi:hypothetical protein